MNSFFKVTDKLYNVVQGIAITLLAFLVTLFFVQAVLRFCFNTALPWAEELCRYMMFWCTFLEGGIGISRSVHVGFDLVVSHVKGRASDAMYVLSNMVVLALSYRMVVDGISLIKQTARQYSPSMGFSMSYVYASILAGGILLALYCVVDILKRVVKVE